MRVYPSPLQPVPPQIRKSVNELSLAEFLPSVKGSDENHQGDGFLSPLLPTNQGAGDSPGESPPRARARSLPYSLHCGRRHVVAHAGQSQSIPPAVWICPAEEGAPPRAAPLPSLWGVGGAGMGAQAVRRWAVCGVAHTAPRGWCEHALGCVDLPRRGRGTCT